MSREPKQEGRQSCDCLRSILGSVTQPFNQDELKSSIGAPKEHVPLGKAELVC